MTVGTVVEAPQVQASPDRKPSARQVYAVAHMTVELLGLEWPASRAACSELIGQLKGLQADEGSKGGVVDDCPL